MKKHDRRAEVALMLLNFGAESYDAGVNAGQRRATNTLEAIRSSIELHDDPCEISAETALEDIRALVDQALADTGAGEAE